MKWVEIIFVILLGIIWYGEEKPQKIDDQDKINYRENFAITTKSEIVFPPPNDKDKRSKDGRNNRLRNGHTNNDDFFRHLYWRNVY